MAIILLRLLHVLCGIIWVGSIFFNAVWLAPVLRGAPQVAGPVAKGLNERKFMQVMPLVALVNVLCGLALLYILGRGNMAMYMSTGMGHTLAWSGALAIIGYFVGLFWSRPANIKAGQLGAQLAAATDPAQKEALQAELIRTRKRGGQAMTVMLVLLLLASAGMAIARYV